MAILPDAVMDKYRSEPTEKLVKRHKMAGFAVIILAIALLALIVMTMLVSTNFGWYPYAFIIGFGVLGFLNRQAVGEILAEREGGSSGGAT